MCAGHYFGSGLSLKNAVIQAKKSIFSTLLLLAPIGIGLFNPLCGVHKPSFLGIEKESIVEQKQLAFAHFLDQGAQFTFLHLGPPDRLGLTGFALGAVQIGVAIVFWLRSLPARGQYWLAIGLALILGGALGNAWDRFFDGYVVDYLHFHWGDAYFPAFNVADIAITTGACMLIIDALLDSRRRRAAA